MSQCSYVVIYFIEFLILELFLLNGDFFITIVRNCVRWIYGFEVVEMNGCLMKGEEHVGSFSCRKGGVIRRSVGGKKGLRTASEMHSHSWSVSGLLADCQPTGD